MLSALDLARRVEAGELTPAQVLDRCAEAIAAREAEIGAFTTLNIDDLRLAAQTPGLKDKPLRGLPVSFKDIFDTVEMPTEYGSPIYAGHRPKADAALVSIVRRAGGLGLGKTVTTEFAHLDPGKTRNPHNPEHTPGGSSSGSAAAVAAGFVPIAVGTQTGGSMIRPASYCGVAGFKPSFGLLPTVGMKCQSWTLDTAGLFAASVADVAFAAGAIADLDLRVDRRAPASPRIVVLRELPWPAASDDMRGAVERAARSAAAAMARVREVRMPSVLAEAFRAHPTIQGYEAVRSLASEYDYGADRLGKQIRTLIDGAMAIPTAAYEEAKRTANLARQAFANLLSEAEVILLPSAPAAAPHGLGATGSSTFNRLWTLLGGPCVNVPGLADPAGLPLGVQVIGRVGSDHATLEAALFVESALTLKR